MPKYRKHVVEVEAFQLTDNVYRDESRWPDWLAESDAIGTGRLSGKLYLLDEEHIFSIIRIGDWVIRGIDNHIHIMDPETFSTTYVEVPDA
jgi:hypothetical protein